MAKKVELEWHHILYPHEITEISFPLNTLKQLKLNGKKYCIAHTPQGFFALDDVCPHAGGSLSQGRCDAKGNVICPLHRYGFNAQTGQNATGLGPNATTYATELRSDGLNIGLPVRKFWLW